MNFKNKKREKKKERGTNREREEEGRRRNSIILLSKFKIESEFKISSTPYNLKIESGEDDG